tara:strand:- start:115 stop:486 length:372 start_codon:yes stop_codon:yes gene_type:complete
MKTIKIVLAIIVINLTLLTIIQTGIWPPKVQASETTLTENNLISNDDVFAVANNVYFSDPDDLNEDSTISGVLINIREMQNWIEYDYEEGRMSYDDAELYFSVLEIVIKQLEKIQQNNSKEND